MKNVGMKGIDVAIITNMPPYSGGGRYAFELFKNLHRKTDAKLVYCGPREKLGSSEVKIIAGGIKVPLLKRTLNAYFYYPSRIPNFQLYHITNQLLTRIAKFKRPCVITILDLYFYKSKRSGPWITRYLMNRSLKYLARCDRIIAISKDTKRDVSRLLGIDPKKIDVVYLGVDHNFYWPRGKMLSRKKLRLPLDKNIVLNFGSDGDYRKNVENVIKSFAKMLERKRDSILIRVGKTDTRITELIAKLGIEENVVRIEKVNEKDMPYYYSCADTYLCLDIETGFGLPILESMTCGTPVVCSNRGAFPEVVGKSGFLVDPQDPRKVGACLVKMLSDKKLEARFVQNGQKWAKNFTWEKMADETLKVYEKVVKETTRH